MSYRYCLSICMSVPEIIHIVCVCVAGGGVFVRQNSRFLLVYMLQRFKLTTL